MFSRAVFVVLVAVTCLTVAAHIWWIPALHYPLLLGTIVHAAVTPDSLEGATDAHGGIPSEERIGFFAELFTNLVVYFLLTMGGVKLWDFARESNSK